VNLYQRTGALEGRTSTGRPPLLTPREQRYVTRLVMTDPNGAATKASRTIKANKGKTISAEGVRRVLRKQGYKGMKKKLKPGLSQQQRKTRLQFAKKMLPMPLDYWKSVIFSDESNFEVYPSRRSNWTWRRPGSKIEPRSIIPTAQHGGGKIMLWSCFTYHGIGWGCKLPQGMDGPTYLEILKDELTITANHYFKSTKNVIFQHDGARVHQYGEAKRWLKKHFVKVIDWPAKSPDLNPIENLWADVKRRIYEKNLDFK